MTSGAGDCCILTTPMIWFFDRNGEKLRYEISRDRTKLRSIGDVHLSPDAARVAYSLVLNDRPGRPYSQIWIMNIASRQSTRLGAADETASGPRWSPDGKSIAYVGAGGERHGLFV